jgi:hypothetical protein
LAAPDLSGPKDVDVAHELVADRDHHPADVLDDGCVEMRV